MNTSILGTELVYSVLNYHSADLAYFQTKKELNRVILSSICLLRAFSSNVYTSINDHSKYAHEHKW